MQTEINVDLKEVENLGFQFREMARVGLYRLTERGEQLLREEVPKVTHNLQQGVTSRVNVATLQGTLSIAARTARVGRQTGSLHLASGKTVEIDLRSRPAFDYAEAVAKGTGVYGPRKAVINPKRGKALLIPVPGPPPAINGKKQSYITSGGQYFVVRRFSKGRRPNPYDVRAAQRLESEAQRIFDRVVEAFANQQKEF